MHIWKALLSSATLVAASREYTLPPGHDFDFTVKFDNQQLSTTSPPAPKQVLNLQNMTGDPEFTLSNIPHVEGTARYITFMQIGAGSVIFYKALRGNATLDDHGVLHQSSPKVLAEKDYFQFQPTKDMPAYDATIEVWRQTPILDSYVDMAQNSTVMLPYAIDRLPNEPSWRTDPGFKYATIEFKVVFAINEDSCDQQKTTGATGECVSSSRPESTPRAKNSSQKKRALDWGHILPIMGVCAAVAV